ncbi:DNA polymerase family X [Penicillium cf. griseofulvum]|uniref:DNA polymerase lambda n=1 Tax=Penicillium cf. griseofulvum TaxID=2972120 RepID=A0A9W9IXT3_9EURO|nr:DNA polymerase family X [Penicillium cf. griseofulvum]KAJ5429607.1 DNA polymerase family X [Penicillium cf. griseofulvum]
MKDHFPSKNAFFAALDRLDDSDDQGEEDKSWGNFLTLADKEVDKPDPNKVALSSERIPLPRANSDPISSCDVQRKSSGPVTVIKPTPANRPRTTGTMPTTKSGPPQKKRRINNAKIIPDDQQIFKGLIFFFFPNNDVSPFRRLRIQRAQDYGARWSRDWATDVTHVIIDKGLLSSDLLSYLKLEALPTSVALVNESYPSECIQFRSVLDTSQLRFRVHGSSTTAEKNNSLVVDPPPPDSLPLKPSRREKDQSPERRLSPVEEPTPNPKSKDLTETVPESVSHAVISDPVNETATEEACKSINWERDSLDDIIDEAKATRHLPLDPLEVPTDESAADGSDIETSSSGEELSWKTRKSATGKRKVKDKSDWTKGFACMQKFDPDTKPDNPNNRTIEVLQQMLEYYTQTADQWRVMAYRKAITALRKQPTKVTTRAQARAIPGVGERLADKIEEIVLTNRLRRLENTNTTQEDLIIQEFLGVYGAGLPQASKWVAHGYRSLKDLLERAPLTKQQRIGVERHSDFAQRIPRKEVEAHGAIVRKAVQAVDRDMQVIIAGSYRRGALTCGDVDCLITKPGASLEQIRTMMLGLIVPRLFSSGFLRASLTISSHQDGSKWHGASALPGTTLWRRIDLLFVPDAEIGAALIYFTGNDIFNRSMRLLARKKGMCLNQKGLFTDVLRNGQVKLNGGRLVEGRDERQIFAVLGVPWRPPEHRIC